MFFCPRGKLESKSSSGALQHWGGSWAAERDRANYLCPMQSSSTCGFLLFLHLATSTFVLPLSCAIWAIQKETLYKVLESHSDNMTCPSKPSYLYLLIMVISYGRLYSSLVLFLQTPASSTGPLIHLLRLNIT